MLRPSPLTRYHSSRPALILVTAALAMLLHAASADGSQAKQPPNILIAIADDQSYPHCSAYGCTFVKTPAFDKVAKRGVLFTTSLDCCRGRTRCGYARGQTGRETVGPSGSPELELPEADVRRSAKRWTLSGAPITFDVAMHIQCEGDGRINGIDIGYGLCARWCQNQRDQQRLHG